MARDRKGKRIEKAGATFSYVPTKARCSRHWRDVVRVIWALRDIKQSLAPFLSRVSCEAMGRVGARKAGSSSCLSKSLRAEPAVEKAVCSTNSSRAKTTTPVVARFLGRRTASAAVFRHGAYNSSCRRIEINAWRA